MIFGLFKKKNPPLKTLVASVFGDDALLMENRRKNQNFVTVAFMALKVAYMDIAKWGDDSITKSLAKHTNHDVFAFEIALFIVCQALIVLEYDNLGEPYDDEFDDDEPNEQGSDVDNRYDCIRDAMHFLKSLAEKDYGNLDSYFVDRVNRYSSASKKACEAFAFNLTCINGAQNFDRLTKKVQLDLNTQLQMTSFATAHRTTIVPAFIDSVNRLLAMEVE